MKTRLLGTLLFAAAVAAARASGPSLTIYNQNFAVVREPVALDLRAGVTAVTCAGVTRVLEPDSVVLRDPTGRVNFRVLEQNYRADVLSQGAMLALNEGKTLDFITRDHDGKEYLVRGKVIRSGYVPKQGRETVMPDEQPIVEVNGQLRFSLPGEPIFPALSDAGVLKPMLTWQIESGAAAKFDAELSYVTGGMQWSASYNLIAPEQGDTLDLVGWVTLTNETGKPFAGASVKLMAGNVNKLAPPMPADDDRVLLSAFKSAGTPEVTEKAFDEFHLYSLPRPVDLHDRETKQVEFIRATGVRSNVYYVYNGAAIPPQFRHWNAEAIRGNRTYGTQSNPRVAVMREIANTEQNGLGRPLPAGRTRFYRRDDADAQVEFTGENTIDHTARNETLRLYTGDAFDIVGERKSVAYVVSDRNDSADESFEIRLRNRKTAPVEVRVVETLYRGLNGRITQKSHAFTQTDAQTIEFRVNVPADGETLVTYTVHYEWK